MPPFGDQERTEQATPKRRQEAREKGQVAKSRELCSVAVLLACLMALYFGRGKMLNQLLDMTRSAFTHLHRLDLTDAAVIHLFQQEVGFLLYITAPVMVMSVAAALFSNYIQIGTLFSAQALTPDLSKLSPLKGAMRLLNLKSLIELLKSILKLIIVATVAFFSIKAEIHRIFPLATQGVWDIFEFIGSVSFQILLRTCWVLIILAVLDFAYQKWDHEREMRMSKQEVKEEFKQTEGDPLVRARIRSVQREMARRRMMEAVPKADVVITNPTHVAVALEYRKGMNAPLVTAKGAGLLAERIKEVARKHHVHIVENQPVARLLYKVCEIGMEIPEKLYRAVAEILAHVYRLRGRTAA
jgi:flagellar biosynthetic protein FlhB